MKTAKPIVPNRPDTVAAGGSIRGRADADGFPALVAWLFGELQDARVGAGRSTTAPDIVGFLTTAPPVRRASFEPIEEAERNEGDGRAPVVAHRT